MNNDLISREAALRAMQESFGGIRIVGMRFGKTLLSNLLGRMSFLMSEAVRMVPAVDATPVVHGRWLPYYEELERVSDIEPYFVVEYVQTGWECSVCGRCESHDVVEMPYCHCGAKMDGEDNA